MGVFFYDFLKAVYRNPVHTEVLIVPGGTLSASEGEVYVCHLRSFCVALLLFFFFLFFPPSKIIGKSEKD